MFQLRHNSTCSGTIPHVPVAIPPEDSIAQSVQFTHNYWTRKIIILIHYHTPQTIAVHSRHKLHKYEQGMRICTIAKFAIVFSKHNSSQRQTAAQQGS
jgi:hypothetical protein